jgi:uncharacterized repeat protein (TIGR02543 family)
MNLKLKSLHLNIRGKYLLIAVLLVCFARSSWGAVQQSRISQFGITWTFDRNYVVGQFANGDYWVIGPITITGISPASVESGGRVINGSMVNPSPRLVRRQGYDSAMYGRYVRPDDYEAGLNVARPNGRDLSKENPLVVNPDSSLVSTISAPEAGTNPLKVAAVLTVLDGPAPEGSFRPPYSGSDKTIRFNKEQLDYSLLASLKPVPGVPSLAIVERYFERVWLDHIPEWPGRSHHPLENMKAYDRDICTQEGIGAVMLNLNFKNHRKETLLVRFVQLGIDNYGVIQDGGRETWLHDSGRKFPILFAGIMLDDPNMKNIGEKSGDYANTAPYGPGNPPPDLIRFEEDEATFYVSQVDVDMAHSPLWKPDSRDAMRVPYEREDIGLPEWGKKRLYYRVYINKCWESIYRKVISPAYGGVILASHIMGIKDLWNHDAIFDYADRYMAVETSYRRKTSRFVEGMWDAYRPKYGAVWTMSPTLNVTSAGGGSVSRYPNTTIYAFGKIVVLTAVADTGYEFAGWSGGLLGNETPVRITMHSNRTITANFVAVSQAPGGRDNKPAYEK